MLRVLLFTVSTIVALVPPRNVVLVVVDDVGWADVGFHGSDFPTPRIDHLAYHESILLDRFYTAPVCSPARAALLTGRYPFRMGLHHESTITAGGSAGIPASVPILPELLPASFERHMVGKWHLGAAGCAQLPTSRGFDTFWGYHMGESDYYAHTHTSCQMPVCLYPTNALRPPHGDGYPGLDLWNDTTPVWDMDYSTTSFRNRVQRATATNRPLFLYYATQLIHVPLQAPPDPIHVSRCVHVREPSRATLCSMMSMLDDSIGELQDQLLRENKWNETLIWILSDNGGSTNWSATVQGLSSFSSNWPLRGGKSTLFDGGIRTISMLTGGWVPASLRGTTFPGLVHVTDVLPTILAILDLPLPSNELDGFDCSDAILARNGSCRSEIPVNIELDPISLAGHVRPVQVNRSATLNYTALIRWPWKLILGVPYLATGDKRGDRGGWWTIRPYTHRPAPNESTPRLFRLDTDASETTNVAAEYPHIVTEMSLGIRDWMTKGYEPTQLNVPMYQGNPALHDWIWKPWINCDGGVDEQ